MIKNILIVLMAGILSCGFTGCPDDRPTPSNNGQAPTGQVANNVPIAPIEMTPEQQKVKTLEKQLEDAQKKIKDATERGDLVARLSAEKEELIIKEKIAEANAKQWKANAEAYKSQAADKDVEIKNAKIDAWKERLWIMAAICGFLGIVAGGIAIGFPLLRSVAWKASAVLGSIAAIMLFVAQSLSTVAWLLGLVPYLIGLAVIVGLIYGAVALRYWFKDHRGLEQVVTGVEPLKDQIEDFSSHMMKYVDTPMENHIKCMRTKLGLKKQKDPEKEALKLALKQALAAKESEKEETEKTV
jgi:uncharacterized membrane-anchored protein YhcB (DUF1043 family)